MQSVLTLLFMGRQQHLTQKSFEQGLESKWKGDRAPVVREDEGDPTLLEQQDVEMPVEVSGGSASVKRGADAVANNEERARLRLAAESKRGQTHDIQDVLEPQAKTKDADWQWSET